MKFLQSSWMVGVLAAVTYLGATAFLFTSSKNSLLKAKAVEAPVKPPNKFLFDYDNPEADQLMSELKEEKKLLAEREQQLDALATRLQAERVELNQVTQTVHQLQHELDRTVVRVREEETANVKKLAKVYAAMAPDAGAVILKEMPDDQVAKILALMKEDEAAPILEVFAKQGETEAKRAAALSERLRLAVFRNPAKPKSE